MKLTDIPIGTSVEHVVTGFVGTVIGYCGNKYVVKLDKPLNVAHHWYTVDCILMELNGVKKVFEQPQTPKQASEYTEVESKLFDKGRQHASDGVPPMVLTGPYFDGYVKGMGWK